MSIPRKEVTEKRLCLEDGEKERARIAAEESVKAEPRINITSPPSGLPRPHPGPLGISTTKANIPVPPPSALATARIIDELGRFPYPEGIKGPKVELNINARDGKFIYDREFLLQFMPVCKEKPESLAAPDAIVPYPTSQPMHIGSKLGEKHNHSNRVPDPESAAALAQSLFEPVAPLRTRSKRGEKRKDSNRVPTGPGSPHGYSMGHESSAALAQSMLEPVAPLQQSANRWDRHSLGSNDPDSLDVVVRKVRGLLNKLTMEKFDSISDQIIAWANKSEKEKDSRTLVQVIRLVFESAVDQATWSEMYARLCRKMMEQISPKVQDDSIKNAEGKPIAGGQLFRKYLLNRCQEDFEQGWATKEAIAAVTAFKAIQDQAPEATAEKEGDGKEGIVLYSNEYYAMQKAKRQGLGLIKFIGELFKLQMLTERIMHECVKKLLWNVENPEEEEIESLCTLLTTVGQLLDTAKARAHMDVYFSRMKELTKSPYVSLRMQFMLQDIIELRERKWISRDAVDAPTTIAQIHAAGKEKAAQEKESYQRQTSMSRSGSCRDGERGEFPQVGGDGWAVAGAPWSPSKAGDLSKFGQISDMTVPATLRQVSGKSSVSIAKPGSSSNTPHRPRKQDIAKLFYNPPSAPPSQASSDTSPPNIRPSDLPPSSQPPSIPSSSHPPYPSFLPQNGMRPQQPNAGPNGDAATSSGPRSPQYQWQVPTGNAPHIPSGPGGHIPVADKKHKAAERELLKTEEEEREKECLQPEVEERKNAEEGSKRLQQEEEEKEPAEEEVVKAEVEATSHPSALAIARIIDDLGRVPYPEGTKSPRVELNINAMDDMTENSFCSLCRYARRSLNHLLLPMLSALSRRTTLTTGNIARALVLCHLSTRPSPQASLSLVRPATRAHLLHLVLRAAFTPDRKTPNLNLSI
ncbi:hypothetical protein ARMGADRAFT_471303 [Armillaria gallica]|uniref:MIF4G domain-containing protein n=1 Tax=Armillaria gallica TaxID=47427 RepID=A0A2H3D7T6_ARMGA|nr:hypothetical protein ARMGADRAFT_471303 [Armillaria gallica]